MNSNPPIEKNITLTQQTAIDALSEACDLTRAELKQCFAKGAVWLTAGQQKPMRLRRVKKALNHGDCIQLYYNPKVLNQTIIAPQLILDKHQYSVWLKPRGMLSQGSKWGDHSALYRWVEMHYQARNESQTRQAWLVHRLDKATAGLQLLAHTKKMAQTLTKLFETRKIKKRYQALGHGQFPESVKTYQTPIDNRCAITHVKRLQFEPTQNLSWVEVDIETGRKHQIRSHLSQAGFPIIGDRLYGNEDLDHRLNQARPNLQLTAYSLEFICPIEHTLLKLQLAPSQLDLMALNNEKIE